MHATGGSELTEWSEHKIVEDIWEWDDALNDVIIIDNNQPMYVHLDDTSHLSIMHTHTWLHIAYNYEGYDYLSSACPPPIHSLVHKLKNCGRYSREILEWRTLWNVKNR